MTSQVQADAAALKAEVRGQLWKDNLRDYGLLGSLLLIVAFFYFITADHASVAPVNITNLVMQNSYVVIMALGMLLIIVAGHIDLSVGSIVGFVGAIGGTLIVYLKVPFPLVILICLAMGALIGAAQGYLVAYAKMPSFIVTLGGMLIFRGLTGNLLLGQFVGPFPKGFQSISSGFLPDITDIGGLATALPEWAQIHWVSLLLGVVGALAMFVSGFRRWRRSKLEGMEVEPLPLLIGKNLVFAAIIVGIAWNLAQYKGLPIILVIMAVLILVYQFVTTRTVVGRRIYALGGNVLAARLSGVKTERLVFFTFANMGFLAALAGLVVAARLNSSTPSAGSGLRARRHRRLLHRRRVGFGRRRQGDERGHRRLVHGRHEQRHVAGRPRHLLAAGGQGPGSARRGLCRRVPEAKGLTERRREPMSPLTVEARDVAQEFGLRFGRMPTVSRAPGRVNLIGEHTDYNDGFVMPAALDFADPRRRRARADRKVRVYSLFMDETREFDLDQPAPSGRHDWSDYVFGVAAMLDESGLSLAGADLVVWSDVPLGRGLEFVGGPRSERRARADRGGGLAVRAGGGGQSRPARGKRIRRHALRHHGPVYRRLRRRRECAPDRLPVA